MTAKHPSTPWSIMGGFDQVFTSTEPEGHHGVSIVAADGETVIAQRVEREHAEMIVTAVNALYGGQSS